MTTGMAYEAMGPQSGVFTRRLRPWAKKISGAAKGVVKGARRAAKKVMKTGIRAGRLGAKVGRYAPKNMLKTVRKLGRQVYRGGRLLHKTVMGASYHYQMTGIKLAVGQAWRQSSHHL